MSAPATIPFSTPNATSPRTNGRPWTPTDRDRLIFQWVKFEGHTQSWVADQLEMSQSTVSRIVDRYEKWIARGGPARSGGLSHDERLRSQRWMTYERNEWIITSSLRIAGEMERALDTSKSTISRPTSNPSRETEVRTEHKVIDRSSVAARFLRLAHRVGMDQLKLVEQTPLPELEPLTVDDQEEQIRSQDSLQESESDSESHAEARRSRRDDEATPEEPEQNKSLRVSAPPREAQSVGFDAAIPAPSSSSNMQSVHIDDSPESPSSDDTTSTCVENAVSKKSLADAYPVVNSPPEIAIAPQLAAVVAEGDLPRRSKE